jgi:hypothetical protein
MAHYAFIDEDSIVVEVIVGRDEDDLVEGVTSWEDYYGAIRGLECLRTSYNGNIRKNYAGLGFTYDVERDAFIPPKPFPSWLLDEESCLWVAPVPYPGGLYDWDENLGEWVEVV